MWLLQTQFVVDSVNPQVIRITRFRCGMSLEQRSDEELAVELRSQIRDFNRRIFKFFLLMMSLLFVETYLLGVILKMGFFVNFFVVPTALFFLYKLMAGFARAVKCPKCGEPYGWNPKRLTNVPFTSRCQSCGLELKWIAGRTQRRNDFGRLRVSSS